LGFAGVGLISENRMWPGEYLAGKMCLLDIFPNGLSLSERRGRGKDFVAGAFPSGAEAPIIFWTHLRHG
jgi:hypothetical protein